MTAPAPKIWVVDSSTFINFVTIDRVRLLAEMRKPLCATRYVYERELTGPRAHDPTRRQATEAVARGQVRLRSLKLSDLERIASLDVPRRVALGERTCAVLAEREGGAVLLDDKTAKSKLQIATSVSIWQSVEDVLVHAAHEHRLTEYELDDCESKLKDGKYHCQVSLRATYLQQALSGRFREAEG